jgi:hypothetical protein
MGPSLAQVALERFHLHQYREAVVAERLKFGQAPNMG